jgi:hypothetical protein
MSGQNLLIGMENTLRDKEVQVAHLMACVYDEQNRTQVCELRPCPGPKSAALRPTPRRHPPVPLQSHPGSSDPASRRRRGLPEPGGASQDKQSQVLRLDAERLELGRKLAEMEGLKRSLAPTTPPPPSHGGASPSLPPSLLRPAVRVASP